MFYKITFHTQILNIYLIIKHNDELILSINNWVKEILFRLLFTVNTFILK